MKKYLALAGLALSAALTSGCSDVASLNEYIAAEESVADRSLLGVWTKDDTTFVVQADGNEYKIRYMEKIPTAMPFRARLAIVNGARILDVVEESDDSFVVPLHVLVRVWTTPNTLEWTFLDSKWMQEQAGRRFSIHQSEKRRIITAAGAEWRKAALLLAADDQAYDGKRETLTRVP
jgi:hypothetical protein